MVDRTGKEDNFFIVTDKIDTKIKAPKNVRQIGRIGEGLRIYVEDYVKTYTRQLAEGDYTNRCIAVLVGEYKNTDIERNVFLYGAIKAEIKEQELTNVFTEETWTSIYEQIKEYFPDAEIVGWYYGGTGIAPEEMSLIEQIQINNFAGRDKVLFTYDTLEKENSVYLFDGTAMILQSGYYIYYEKNTAMQEYMIQNKKVKREEADVDDHALYEMRTLLNEKKEKNPHDTEQKFILRLGYVAGTLMLVVALIAGVTMYNNGKKGRELEADLEVMKDNIFEPTMEAEKLADNSEEEESKTAKENENSVTDKVTEQPTIIITPTPAIESEITQAPQKEDSVESGNQTEVAEKEQESVPVTTLKPENLKEYIVKEGDTLASICIKECGSYSLITSVKELNQIEDENIILAGQTLLLPKQKEVKK